MVADTRLNLKLNPNSINPFSFVWQDGNGSPINYTGSTFKLDVKARTANGDATGPILLTLETGDGISGAVAEGRMSLAFPAEANNGLPVGQYIFDIVRLVGGDAVDSLVWGHIDVIEGITTQEPVAPGDAAETTAFLARATDLNDDVFVAATRNLINGLVTLDAWDDIDAVWLDATQNAATAVLELKSAAHNATLEGGISFTAGMGFNSFGDASKRVVRNWKPITHGVNYQEANACVGFYDWQAAEDYQRAVFFDAPHGSEGMFVVCRYPGAGAGIMDLNDNDQAGFPSADGSGHFHMTRTGAVIKIFRNNIELASHTTASSGPPPDQNLCTGEWHNGHIGYLYIGRDLSPTKRTGVDALFADYMTAIAP